MHDLTARLFDDADSGPLDPFELFETWYAEAAKSEPNDPNAMALATVDASGMPDVRTVLMNGHDSSGLIFYTNSQSEKGRQLAAAPKAALLFHWKALRRQVRLRGVVIEVTPDEASAYFASRPRVSKLGAHASAQSRPLASRAELIARTDGFDKKFADTDVPRPDYWTGYRIKPQFWEFWQNGEFRLHDRVRFEKSASGWTRQRLNP